jgi:hypothetical protein
MRALKYYRVLVLKSIRDRRKDEFVHRVVVV